MSAKKQSFVLLTQSSSGVDPVHVLMDLLSVYCTDEVMTDCITTALYNYFLVNGRNMDFFLQNGQGIHLLIESILCHPYYQSNLFEDLLSNLFDSSQKPTIKFVILLHTLALLSKSLKQLKKSDIVVPNSSQLMFQLSRIIQLALDNTVLTSAMESMSQYAFYIFSVLIKQQQSELDTNFISLCVTLCSHFAYHSNVIICQAKMSILHCFVNGYKLNQTPVLCQVICQIMKQFPTNKSIQRKGNLILTKQVAYLDKNMAPELTTLSLLTSVNDTLLSLLPNAHASVTFLFVLQAHVKQMHSVERVTAFLVKSVCAHASEISLVKQAIYLLSLSLEQVVLNDKFKLVCQKLLVQYGNEERSLLSQIISLLWCGVSKEMIHTDEALLQILCQVAKEECLNKPEALNLVWHHFRCTNHISQQCSQLVAIPLIHLYCHALTHEQLSNDHMINQLIQTVTFACQKSNDTCQYVIANTTIATTLFSNSAYCNNEMIMESMSLLWSHLASASADIANQLIPYIAECIPLFTNYFANEFICSHLLQLFVHCMTHVKLSQEESRTWLDYSLRVFKMFGNRKSIFENSCKVMIVFCQCKWNQSQMVQVKYGEEGLFSILTNLQLFSSQPSICQVSLQALSEMAKHIPYQSIIASPHNISLVQQILSQFLNSNNTQVALNALVLLSQITNPFVLDSLDIIKQLCYHSKTLVQLLSKALATMKCQPNDTTCQIQQGISQVLEQLFSPNANQQLVLFDMCFQGSFEPLLQICQNYSDHTSILMNCVTIMDSILSIPLNSDYYKFKLLRQEKGILCQVLQTLLMEHRLSNHPIVQRMVQNVNGFEEKKAKLLKKGKIRDWIDRDCILNRLNFFYMKENRKVKTLIDLRTASCECFEFSKQHKFCVQVTDTTNPKKLIIFDAKSTELQQEWYEAIMYCIENAGNQKKKINVEAILQQQQQVVKQRSATVATSSPNPKKVLPTPIKSTNTSSVQSSPKVIPSSAVTTAVEDQSDSEELEEEEGQSQYPIHPTVMRQ